MEKMNNHQGIILWGIKASPYVRKVMVALIEKNISYEHREILPEVILRATNQPVPEDFKRASPFGKIPAIQVDDFYIADSAVIAAYLERKFNTGASLYPKDSQQYAEALWFEKFADVTLTDVIYKKIFFEAIIKPNLLKQNGNQEIIEYAKTKELPPLLDYLELAVTNKEWVVDDHFSMADVAIVMQLLAAKTAGFDILEYRWPAIKKYIENVITRPSIHKVIA